MNVYTLSGKHIGKRYAAGIWCWDCKQEARQDIVGAFYFCAKCAKRCSLETLSYNPAFRELGFDKTPPRVKTGIDGASGWIWCVDPETGVASSGTTIKLALKKYRFVKTEYDKKLTIRQFQELFKDIIVETETDSSFS